MTFKERVKNELEPIAAHAIVLLFLELTLLATGGVIWCLQYLFPSHAPDYDRVETWDIWTAFVFFVMFAVYAVIRLLIRLIRGIVQEWQEKH